MAEEVGSNSSNNPENHMVDVNGVKKPTLGMEFETLDEVFTFYNNYAREMGFSVRKHTSVYWKNSKELMLKYYVCSKEGVRRPVVGGESKRKHRIIREDCNAKLVVLKRQSLSTFLISQFVEEHNHALEAPHKRHMLRSHRKVSAVKKQVSQQFSEVNIPTCDEINLSELQENTGCTEKDTYDYQRGQCKEMDRHDIEMLFEHFTYKQNENSAFYFKMEQDQNKRLYRCFWADATSREAYCFYGDVVVFDIAYNTNRSDMKFAYLYGVNKHGQTVVFACAYLTNENTESFIWVFEQFKKAMRSAQPKVFITNQDAAITDAVSIVFPETFHRFCIWHVEKNISKKLDASSPYYDYNAFRSCIWDSETPEEFDLRWVGVVVKNKVTENVWLASIFHVRSKWVPCYVNHIFSAGMRSSQMVESSHAFFQRYVSRKNSLFEFIIRFKRALSHQRRTELEKDHIDLNTKPALKSPMTMEKQMSSIYTRYIFDKFQYELWTSLTCVLTQVEKNDNQCSYKVIERDTTNNLNFRERKLTYKKDLDHAWCSCKKFESEGIPCRHLLAYLRMTQLEFLPTQYIHKRWTKIANAEVLFDEEDASVIYGNVDTALIMKRNRLMRLATQIIDKALASDIATEQVYDMLQSTFEKIKSMVEKQRVGESEGGGNVSVCGEASYCSQQIINDPFLV